MRAVIYAIILSFLATGYSAGVYAFSKMADCPMSGSKSMDMPDCPKHHDNTKTSCADCCFIHVACLAAVARLIEEPQAFTPELQPMHNIALCVLYPALRPPTLSLA